MKQKAIIYLLALFEPMIGYATPCDKMDVMLPQKEKVRISYVIASNLKKEMPQISDVEILKIFKSESWSMVYVGTKVSDETILFYKRDPLKSSFIAKWPGQQWLVKIKNWRYGLDKMQLVFLSVSRNASHGM